MWTSGVSTGSRRFRIIESERDFRGVHWPPRGRAVENDVGHFLAAEALDALLAQHPFDGIDDVRLAGAVRADNYRDPGRKLEPRLVGEAFEADEFQALSMG